MGKHIEKVAHDPSTGNSLYYFDDGTLVTWARSVDDDYYFVHQDNDLLAEGHLLARPESTTGEREAIGEVDRKVIEMVLEVDRLENGKEKMPEVEANSEEVSFMNRLKAVWSR